MINDLKKIRPMENSSDNEHDFTSSKNNDEKPLMHSKSYKKEVMRGFNTEEIIEDFFICLCRGIRYS